MAAPRLSAILLLACVSCSAGSTREIPPCGSRTYGGRYLLAGPGEVGFDAELERSARKIDRIYHGLGTYATGLVSDLELATTSTPARDDVEAFIRDDDGFDFEAARGKKPERVIEGWEKSAGLYGGVGLAADAFRYGVLRDQGYECAEIETARGHLVRSLEALHTASAITGVPGVIARSLARTDLPGPAVELVPLFDGSGNPLPVEKNNGTWRADNSGGMYPNLVWEDSTSRDMLVGWAMAYGAAWEVIRDDPSFAEALKTRMRADAKDLLTALSTVRSQGYDLEIPDADGRTTFHGYLNENAFERGYIPDVGNGFYAGMAIGITAALAFVAEDAALSRYVDEELVTKRDLPAIAGRDMLEVNLGLISNFSNYNMAFTAMWLGTRYVASETGRGKLRVALDRGLYNVRESDRQPLEMKQSFFDFIFAAGLAESRPNAAALRAFDTEAAARGVETLATYPAAPYWDYGVTNCDEAEIMAKECTCVDGTIIHLANGLGRGDILVAKEPVPMKTRPPSNYHWRSNPYAVNGGGNGGRLNSAVDFRVAYWLGRFVLGASD